MSDLSKHLPLSNRSTGDESGVSSDRRVAIAALVDEAARLVATSTSTDGNAVAVFLDDARLVREASADLEPVVRLAETARAVRDGKRRGIRPLVHAAGALLRLAEALGVATTIDPQTCGVIVLWGATSGQFARRVVLSGHTIRATDADWEFGHGPVLEGTALQIAAFVLAVSDVPPQPPVTH